MVEIEAPGKDLANTESEFDFKSMTIKDNRGKVLDLSLLPVSYLKAKKKEMDELAEYKK